MKWTGKHAKLITAFIFAVVLLFAFAGMAFAGTATVPVSGKIAGWILASCALAAGMALSADTPRAYELGSINELPVKASSTIYQGSAVGDDGSGYARALVAGDPFRGFAESKADNSSGSAGDINVRVKTEGLIAATFTSIAITNVGDDVYMSDDGTFTLTSTSNTRIGVVYRYVSSTSAVVAFGVRETQTISHAELGADCVDGDNIADDAIDSEHYAAGSIDTAHVAADAVDGTLIADDAVSLEHLDSGITPSHVVKYAGSHTSTADGGGVNAKTVTGVASTDVVVATLRAKGSTPVTLTTTIPSANTITFTFSGDPSTDHVVDYVVFRAVV